MKALVAQAPELEFLVFFVHRHFEFRYPELDALLTLQGLRFDDCVNRSTLPDASKTPLLTIKLPSIHHAKFLSQRGILIKGVYEVWGHTASDDYDQLVSCVAQFNGPSKQMALQDDHVSWRISVDAFGKKLKCTEQQIRREKFRHVLPFPGPVVMKNPSETFLILEEIGVDGDFLPDLKPKQLFFLREIAGSDRNRGRGGARDLIDLQTLKRRAYIGPTSMESEMALIMANMALVQAHDVVMDPFVGTGSVLIPCATHGAVCFGTDIDIRVLLGTGVGVPCWKKPGAKRQASTQDDDDDDNDEAARANVLSNFKQYQLPLPELIRADNSLSPLVTQCKDFFDAIVCDPPYGIRAGARKSGRRNTKQQAEKVQERQQKLQTLSQEEKASIIPVTQPYAAEEVMNDLLQFAAATLKVGGRLVYLLPTTYEYTDNDLPTHPQLVMIANSEQKLTLKYARRLITMVKRSNASHKAAAAVATGDVEKEESDLSYANLREKIVETNRKRKAMENAQEPHDSDHD